MLERSISVAEASDALDALDDYSRMNTGVDAIGPRSVLEMFIRQVGEERKVRDDALPYSFDLFYDIKSKRSLYDHLTGRQRMFVAATDEELKEMMREHGVPMPDGTMIQPKAKGVLGVLQKLFGAPIK